MKNPFVSYIIQLARVPSLRRGKNKNKNKIYTNISMVNLAFVIAFFISSIEKIIRINEITVL